MACEKDFRVGINLNQNELQYAVVHPLATAPAVSASTEGQIYYNNVDNTVYYFDGTAWVDMGGDVKNILEGNYISVTESNDVFTIAVTGTSSSNVADTIVIRDGSGNFSANVITVNDITITNAPTNGTDGVNKDYVDGLINGIDWKDSVRALENVSNVTLNGTTTIDGVALSDGDRVLLNAQTDASENGFWIVRTGAWERPADFVSGDSAANNAVFIEEGTTYADTAWVQTANEGSAVIDTDNLTWVQFSSAGAVIAGSGLTKNGLTIDFVNGDNSLTVAANDVVVNVDNVTIETDATNGVQVKASGITETQLNPSVAGDGLIGGGGTALAVGSGDSSVTITADDIAVNVDNSTLETGVNGVQIKASGVTETELNPSVAGDGLTGGGGSPLAVGSGDSSVTITADDIAVNVDGTSIETTANGIGVIGYTSVTGTTVARKYSESVSLGTSPGVQTITHNMSSEDVVVSVRDTATGKLVETCVTVVDANSIQVEANGTTFTGDVTIIG